MFKFWKLRSIQTNIVLAFIILILITILTMSILSFYLSQNAVQNNSQIYTEQVVKQVNTNIKSYFNSMEYTANLVADSDVVQQFLRANRETLREQPQLVRDAESLLQSITQSRADISSINIVRYDDIFISGNVNRSLNPNITFNSFSWYKDARAADGRSVVSPSHVQPLFKGEYPWVVSLSRELQSEDRRQKFGILLVDLNFNVMNEMLADVKLGQRGYLFIVDQRGQIVYHPQQQLIYSGLKNEQIDQVLHSNRDSFQVGSGDAQKLYTMQQSLYGWYVVGVAYATELFGNQDEVRNSFIGLGIFMVLIGVAFAVYLSLPVIRPLKLLQQSMREVEKGNFDIQVPVPQTDEVAKLATTFNIMVGRIKDLMVQTVLDQEQKRRSEMVALQAQINPHFLYNTLDSIIWMAQSNKSAEVVQMTSALAKLLRSSISREEEMVSIATELEHVENYLKIQQMRYKNKLEYDIHIPDSLIKYQTIKIIIQPIVENAIYHGIKQKKSGGRISIRAIEQADAIELIVQDNGIGMDEATIANLLSGNVAPSSSGGLGVRNVHERIQLSFGMQFGLSFRSMLGEGTTVTIRIPKKEV